MNGVSARAWRVLLPAMAALVVASMACGGGEEEQTSPAASSATTSAAQPQAAIMQWDAPPAMSLDTEKQYHATLRTTYGDITVELYQDEAPIAVNNFVFLARQGFYNGVRFHRIVRGFMVQGGDPTGTGRGGPGYRFADEPVTRDYLRGTLAMANSGPDTNGSQFFIMHQDYGLSKDYTIFGMVTDGWVVLDAIANTAVSARVPGDEQSLPLDDILIQSIEVSEGDRTSSATPPPTPSAAAPATPSAATTAAQQPQEANMQWDAPPAMSIDTEKQYRVTLRTTYGDITVELFPGEVPVTVNNFVFLARQGFYNGVRFHRIIRGFMVQTGDPTGTGRGGPGYRFADEPVTRAYLRGSLAMANAGPNTNGSQFFIMHGDYALPPNYTIFGMLTEGLDVLDAIADSPVSVGPSGERSQPVEEIVIQSIEVSEE